MPEPEHTSSHHLVRRHCIVGWAFLLVFLTLRLTLEALHAFKARWYLEEAYTTRRLMWTLAHAHGVLLALINIALGSTIKQLDLSSTRSLRLASPLLVVASVIMPAGFFLGGGTFHGGDPGVGIWLAPIGGVGLFGAVLLTLVAAIGSKK